MVCVCFLRPAVSHLWLVPAAPTAPTETILPNMQWFDIELGCNTVNAVNYNCVSPPIRYQFQSRWHQKHPCLLTILLFAIALCSYISGTFRPVSPSCSPNVRLIFSVTALPTFWTVFPGIFLLSWFRLVRIATESSRSKLNHFSLVWLICQSAPDADFEAVLFPKTTQ